MQNLTNRQKLILKAVTETYNETGLPVSSEEISKLPYLEFSSATIRFDMADLEAMGLLEKPHTSGGRIPTNLGYEYYLDNLITKDIDLKRFYPIVDNIIKENKHRKEHAIKTVISWLSNLTNTTIVNTAPASTLIIAKIDLIHLSEQTALLVIVTEDSRVQSETVNMPALMAYYDIDKVIKKFNDLLVGKTVDMAIRLFKSDEIIKKINILINYQEMLTDLFLDAFQKFITESNYLEGIPNLITNQAIDKVELINAFTERIRNEDFLKLITNDQGLAVRLHNSIDFLPHGNCSVISIPYQINENDNGALAIIGPKRMDYKKIIPLIQYIAAQLSELFINNENDDKED